MNSLMKIIILAFVVLFMTACTATSPKRSGLVKTFTPSSAATETSTNPGIPYNRSMDAFEFDENCPNGCFLRIKPLVTTPLEAFHILQDSPDIDPTTIYISNGFTLTKNLTDASISQMEKGDILEAYWNPTNKKGYGDYVHLNATNNSIDYIDASPVSTTVQDFISVIGEPDEIQVTGAVMPGEGYMISYSTYYAKWKLLIYTLVASIDGPKPDDNANTVVLNQEINDADFQPWTGYGKMRDYMTSEQLSLYQQNSPSNSTGTP